MLLVVKENKRNIKVYENPKVILVGGRDEKKDKVLNIYYEDNCVQLQIGYENSYIIVNGTMIEKNVKGIRFECSSIIEIKNRKNSVEIEMVLDDNSEWMDIEKSKKLPFVIPKYSTYPKYTAILGILTAYNNEEAWIYNNYILLWAYIWIESREYWTDFKYGNEKIKKDFCPMIQVERVKKGKITGDNIINFVKEEIDKRRYCFFMLDMYYIDKWWGKKKEKKHCTHQTLIWGYNCEKKIVYVSDFFEKKYQTIILSYDLLVKSYVSGLSERSAMCEKYMSDEIMSYEHIPYEIDINLIKGQLEDFLFSKDSCRYNFLNLYQRGNVAYGMEFFRIVHTYLNDAFYNNYRLDIRPFGFIKEFNEIMVDRISYLQNVISDTIQEEYKRFLELSNNSKIIINLILKYNVRKRRDTLLFLKGEFEKLIVMEQEAIECLYDVLNKNKEKKKIKNNELLLNSDKYSKLIYFEKRITSLWKNRESIEICNVNRYVYSESYNFEIFPYEYEKTGKCVNGEVWTEKKAGKDIHVYGFDKQNRLVIHTLQEAEMTRYTTETYYTYLYEKEAIIKIGRYLDKDTLKIRVGNIRILLLKEEVPYIELYYQGDGLRNITTYNFIKRKLVSTNVISMEKNVNGYRKLDNWEERYVYNNDKLKQILLCKNNSKRTVYPQYGVKQLSNYEMKMKIMNCLRTEISKNILENNIYQIDGIWNLNLQILNIKFKSEKIVTELKVDLYEGYVAESESNYIIPNIFRECIYEYLQSKNNYTDFSSILLYVKSDTFVISEKL